MTHSNRLNYKAKISKLKDEVEDRKFRTGQAICEKTITDSLEKAKSSLSQIHELTDKIRSIMPDAFGALVETKLGYVYDMEYTPNSEDKEIHRAPIGPVLHRCPTLIKDLAERVLFLNEELIAAKEEINRLSNYEMAAHAIARDLDEWHTENVLVGPSATADEVLEANENLGTSADIVYEHVRDITIDTDDEE